MTIASSFPDSLKSFLHGIEEEGFLLTLVGGAPRDFLLDKKLSQDLDFEVRLLEISRLKTYFKNNSILFTELPYSICRVDFEGFDLEFSPPRKEVPLKDNKTHHHFEAVIDKDMDYKESFKRRDFTVNAMGIELDLKNKKEQIVDPYNGARDLQSKTLKEVSDDFFLDSVRFLRLIRFMIKYNFEMAHTIESGLIRFDLSELSAHHFKEEMVKSLKPGVFINAFNHLVKRYQLKISPEFLVLQNFKFTPSSLDKMDLLVEAFLQNESEAERLSKFFSFPEKKIKELRSFHESFERMKKMTATEMKMIASAPLTDNQFLKDARNLEDKKEFREYFLDKLPFSWDDWSEVRVSQDEIEKTPVQLRSLVRYYHALKGLIHD